MSFDVNETRLLGRLGKDPEVRYTPGGQCVANLSLATSDSYKDKETNEWKEKTEWHKVVVWGDQAESIAANIGKGSRVYLAGKLQTKKWQDKTGADRWTTEVNAKKVIFLDAKGERPQAPEQQQSQPEQDDLAF